MSNTNPPVKRRSVTRTIFASPVFWLAFGAYVAGLLSAIAGYVPGLIGASLVGFGIAGLTGAIERWYVQRRAKAMVLQGIADATELRPDIFTTPTRVAWIEGSRRFGGRPR